MYYLGVDLGGTNIAVGLVNENGEIVKSDSVPTKRERPYNEILFDLAELCKKVVADFGITLKDVKSLGIGSPGTCNNDEGVIIYANNINFRDTPVRAEIQKYIDIPVYIANDADSAALGEASFGAAKGCRNSITVTLGTGVGTGLIINEAIYCGTFHGAGEVGHHIIIKDGELCTCGRKGCWESYASATALIRETKIAAIENPECKILDYSNGKVDDITAKTVFDAKDAGDKVAIKVVDDYLEYVAEGLTNLVNIFQPEVIAIGGGVCAQGDKILLPIVEKVKAKIYGGNLKTKFAIAKLGNDAGIIGAAMLGYNK